MAVVLEPKDSWFRRWFPYLRWVPSSAQELKNAEETLLSFVDTKSEGWYVEVEVDGAEKCRIWTRKFASNQDSDDKDALVMLHGMGAGLGFYCMNYDELCQSRVVYALDLPGFARSSRANFSSDPDKAEQQYVGALENWRQNVGLSRFCLLGHSFGAYLASAYAINYPGRVSHLILADPWGFPEKPVDLARRYNIPWWIRALFHVFRHFNPLASLRLSGPLGPATIKRMRPDLISKFQDLFESEEHCRTVIPDYLFHCNAHSPTGEAAFHSMMTGFAWAKNPMFPRLAQLHHNIPLTALYGQESWVSPISQEQFESVRTGGVYTQSKLISDAGHHVYAQYRTFNNEVITACHKSDQMKHQSSSSSE